MNMRKPPFAIRPSRIPRHCVGVLLPIRMILIRAAIVLAAMSLWSKTSSTREPIQQRRLAGPVLHYTFDARTGQSVENQAGEKHVGRRRGALFQSSGAVGRALVVWKDKPQFGYIETPDHKELNSPEFTVAAWIKLRKKASSGSVVCKHDWREGIGRGFVLRCYTAESINFTIGAGGWKSTNGATRVPANQWVHVAGTFDGRHIRVFCNGRLEGTNEISHAYTPSPLPLRIGHAAYVLENKRKFDGQIDDVMFWNRALSEEELRALFSIQKRI